MRKLGLYLVTRQDEISWDEYEGFVVAAPNPEVARQVHPRGRQEAWEQSSSWVSREDRDKLRVVRVGDAGKRIKSRKIILASHIAG